MRNDWREDTQAPPPPEERPGEDAKALHGQRTDQWVPDEMAALPPTPIGGKAGRSTRIWLPPRLVFTCQGCGGHGLVYWERDDGKTYLTPCQMCNPEMEKNVRKMRESGRKQRARWE